MLQTALTECGGYDAGEVDSAVRRAVTLAGGISVQPGQRVFIKANLVAKYRPEAAVTTHPEVIRALVRMVQEQGGTAVVGDSAGGVFSAGYMNPIYEATGMKRVCEENGAELNADYGSSEVYFERGVGAKRFEFIDALLKADVIINAAKYKTHTFTGYSGAAKNMFGAIAGLKKVELHGSHRDVFKFADVILDIQEFFADKMQMHVIDAVTGMEGDGPTGGNPREIHRIIASKCPYSADVAALAVTCNEIESMPIVKRALERGLVTLNPGERETAIVDCAVEDSLIRNYHNVKVHPNQPLSKVPKRLQKIFYRLSCQRPVMPKSKCRGCKKCETHCPPGAIAMREGKAVVDYEKCIRCFCCQELCPFHAVKIKTPILARVYRLLK